MASVFQKEPKGRWYARFRDAAGVWQRQVTACTSKRDAQRVAEDLERQAERVRNGLDTLPDTAAPMTFGALYEWWWSAYGSKRRGRSNDLNDKFNRARLSPLWPITLREVTSGRLEEVLQGLVDDLAPKSINMLRGEVHTIFDKATRAGKWRGENPARSVQRRKVPKRLPTVLRAEEVGALLTHLDARWRPLFATAVYTGMRKGELLGLRKTAVDLAAGVIRVERSYAAETTKGGHADSLPIAPQLRPWLESAIATARGALVFPKPDGSMQSEKADLQGVLRRALGRAGIVEGYTNKCRRCTFKDESTDASRAPCPECGMRLWPVAHPRNLRFHDLRHTAATLLLKAGVPIAVVQLLMRHADIRTTIETYGHLDDTDARAGMNRLNLPMPAWFSPSVSPTSPTTKTKPPESVDFSNNSEGFYQSGRQDLNLRPLGPEPSALPG
jgi:integrase